MRSQTKSTCEKGSFETRLSVARQTSILVARLGLHWYSIVIGTSQPGHCQSRHMHRRDNLSFRFIDTKGKSLGMQIKSNMAIGPAELIYLVWPKQPRTCLSPPCQMTPAPLRTILGSHHSSALDQLETFTLYNHYAKPAH